MNDTSGEALADMYGPQWRDVITLIEQAAAITPAQGEVMASMWESTRKSAYGDTRKATVAAYSAARVNRSRPSRTKARENTQSAVQKAVRVTLQGTVGANVLVSVQTAARNAARATVVSDLITARNFDVLTASWKHGINSPAVSSQKDSNEERNALHTKKFWTIADVATYLGYTNDKMTARVTSAQRALQRLGVEAEADIRNGRAFVYSPKKVIKAVEKRPGKGCW